MMNTEAQESSLNMLRIIRQETDSIGVAVSFGKDSLCTLDLCCRVFERVEGYYLYRVAGLRIVDDWASDVKVRFGVTVRMYPHFILSKCYQHGVYSPHWNGGEKARGLKLRQIEDQFRADSNVDWLAMGWRRNDSFSRAIIMKTCAGLDFKTRRVFPLRAWRRQDVYDYLSARKIPLPNGLGRKDQGGLDFHAGALGYLKTNYPDDYEKWLRDFPFSEVALK